MRSVNLIGIFNDFLRAKNYPSPSLQHNFIVFFFLVVATSVAKYLDAKFHLKEYSGCSLYEYQNTFSLMLHTIN